MSYYSFYEEITHTFAEFLPEALALNGTVVEWTDGGWGVDTWIARGEIDVCRLIRESEGIILDDGVRVERSTFTPAHQFILMHDTLPLEIPLREKNLVHADLDEVWEDDVLDRDALTPDMRYLQEYAWAIVQDRLKDAYRNADLYRDTYYAIANTELPPSAELTLLMEIYSDFDFDLKLIPPCEEEYGIDVNEEYELWEYPVEEIVNGNIKVADVELTVTNSDREVSFSTDGAVILKSEELDQFLLEHFTRLVNQLAFQEA